MMPQRTYLVFGDIEGALDTLRVECTKCSRKGRYISAKGVPICSWAMCRASSPSIAISSGRPIMKKLGMLGIIGGAALLTVSPFSLQWPQDQVSLSLNSANARVAGVHRRVYRRTYSRAAYAAGYGYGSYYGYSSPYYSSYYAPRGRTRSYSVRSYAPTYPPPGDSYYVPPFATVLSYDPRIP